MSRNNVSAPNFKGQISKNNCSLRDCPLKMGPLSYPEMSVPHLRCATFQKFKDIGYNLGGDYTGLLYTLLASELTHQLSREQRVN
jgi:hypothetical protein